MRRAAFALALLASAASAAFAARSDDLNRRAARLLREIRRQADLPEKDVAPLREELKALRAQRENSADDAASQRLELAARNLDLLESGEALPPADSAENDEDEAPEGAAPEPETPGAPAPSPPAELRDAVAAAVPGAEGVYFDRSTVRPAEPVAVGRPTQADQNLDALLSLPEGEPRHAHLKTASARLLEKLQRRDPNGDRSRVLARKLHDHLSRHPRKALMSALSLKATPDAHLHLAYRLKDGGSAEEDLGLLEDWFADAPMKGGRGGRGGGGGKPRAAKGGKGGKGGDDEGGGGGGGRGRRGGGGGRRGRGGKAGGGFGGGKGDGGFAGGPSARSGRSSRAKGGAAFDGAPGAAGPASSGGLTASRPSKRSGSVPGAKGSAPASPGAARRSASVPLPKDFPHRREQRLPAGSVRGGDSASARPTPARSSGGAGFAGRGFMPGAGWRGAPTPAPAPAAAAPPAAAPASPVARGGNPAAVASAPAASGAAAPPAAEAPAPRPAAPATDEPLRDAVAAHAAALPKASPAPRSSPAPEPEPLQAGAFGALAGVAAIAALVAFARRKRA